MPVERQYFAVVTVFIAPFLLTAALLAFIFFYLLESKPAAIVSQPPKNREAEKEREGDFIVILSCCGIGF